ncbi:MAG: CBS domain-containing protein [Nitrospiraceae bacterium]|nr:CBS domain-containing protein [Nitrospiraceae bacterium]
MKIITSHINADFDAFASMIAAKKLYTDAEIVFSGSQEKKLRDFIETFHPAVFKRIKDINFSEIKKLILVDTKKSDRIGLLSESISNPSLEIHIYDHHPYSNDDIHGNFEIIDNVGATATIFSEILKSKNLHPTPMEATIMCLGIYEETGSLTFPSTTERDLLAAAYLVKHGANLNIVSNFLTVDLSREELDILNELLQSSKEFIIEGIRIKIAKATRESYSGDAAHLAHRIMDMEPIDAVFLILGIEGKILIVSRSRAPELNAADILKEFNGGGHPSAASATIKEASIEIIEERLIKKIELHVKPEKTASDIMTTPVISTDWNSTIKEIEKTMTKYGVNVLPVMKNLKYTGLISREVVEKALFHRLGKSKAIDFCTTDASTVTANTPIREIEHIMVAQNQRFMPVIENDLIIGAITRTDLLRTMYEDFLKRSRIGKHEVIGRTSFTRNLSSLLREKFPSEIYSLLKLTGKTGDELKVNVYLVGGSVRDLLRGEQNLDIDIVVEGDGIFFAKTLGEKLKAKIKTHKRFGTAKISIGKHSLDIATSRTEYYESPAALPIVETSSIKKDLYRRDFTINTLAVKLNHKDFGLLIDFFGGQRDLRDKIIRVIHNLSFVEDPTRAFRAIRFSERFGFKLSKHTENLIKTTLKIDMFGKLSGERLYDELILTFNEKYPVKTLKKLSEFDLLKVINPSLTFTNELESSLQSVFETLAWFNLLYLEEIPDKGIVYIMALLSELKENEKKVSAERLNMSLKTKQTIINGIAVGKEILKKISFDNNVKTYHLLKDISLEILLFSMAICKDKTKQKTISHYLIELRKTKPFLDGNDLKKMGVRPGPLYSRLFEKLIDEKLRGRIKTKEDEEKFIKQEMVRQ